MRRLAAIGAMRLSLAVKGRIDKDIYTRFSNVLTDDVKEADIAEAENYAFEEFEDDEPLTKAAYRVNVLMSLLGDDVVARSLTELCMLQIMDPSVCEVLNMVSPGNDNGITLLTAARCAGYFGKVDDTIFPCREAQEKVSFLFREIPIENVPFFKVPYRPDDWLLGFLSGSDVPDIVFSDFSDTFDPNDELGAIYGFDDEIKALSNRIAKLYENNTGKGDPVNVIISGENESGRFTMVKAVAKRLNLSLLSIDYSYILGTIEPKELIRRLTRACALDERALVVRGITKNDSTSFLMEKLKNVYNAYVDLPLFLLTDTSVRLVPSISGRNVLMKIPTGDEITLSLWQGFLPDEYKEFADSLASKMKLTAGQTKRVVTAMRTRMAAGETVDEHLICRLCYEVLDDGRYDNIKRVEPGFTLKDLKIDDHNRSVLNDVCAQVELRRKVYSGWDLKKRYAYGRCVSVILAGPPGTGKTMTVHALAGQLGLELYKVDLSQVVDKYVGETEKRLEEVFTKAQKSNMILFFDEADAVMSKRSEVKDSKDKYANTEISFILQRIEEYDGIVFLATNNLQNIDTAFMRRIRYVINFNLPDKDTRKEIWMHAFGDSVPLMDDIDYEFLAEKFELSGGEIKNIVLNAVFYGAADKGKVGMEHIMKAVFRESTKLKRIAFDGDYGGYAYLLHD